MRPSLRTMLAGRIVLAGLALPLGLGMASGAAAQTGQPAQAEQSRHTPPKLIVAISVDQLSGDLFAQYRERFTEGFARLLRGGVFPSAFQGHAATETCPGHSTILTGVRPARNGIVANYWYASSIARADKRIYCAEDERDPQSTSRDPVVSAWHLNVPTLGDRVKAANPRALNVAVSAKDRAVAMMGGHTIDQGWWWKGGRFVTFRGAPDSPAANLVSAQAAKLIKSGAKPFAVPPGCAQFDHPVALDRMTVGTGRFALAPGAASAFGGSPRMDAATGDLALRLVDETGLGRDDVADVLSVSFSATDYVGHGTGHQGMEMCIQLTQLDHTIGVLLAGLDKRKLDYMVVLTADHGGIDVSERLDAQAYPAAVRVDGELTLASLSEAITQSTGIRATSGLLLYGDGPIGDIYLAKSLSASDKAKVTAALVALLDGHPQVAAVYTAAEIAATPPPAGSPQDWSLKERTRASFNPARSGDVIVLPERGVSLISHPAPGYATGHGSPWDYDRRVPMLFWRKGMAPFEQPAPVETVDIAPTLAAVLGLAVPEGDFDGRCLDLDAGAGNTCGDKP